MPMVKGKLTIVLFLLAPLHQAGPSPALCGMIIGKIREIGKLGDGQFHQT
jgi:hypothetical protein